MSLKKITTVGVIADILLALDNGLKNGWWSPFASRQDSLHADGEEHAFMGGVTGPQKNKSAFEFGELGEFPFQIKNHSWKGGFRIHRTKWMELMKQGHLGMLQTRIQESVQLAVNKPGLLIMDLAEAGTTTTCYDGVNFFDDDHPILVNGAASTQSNILAVSKSTPAIEAKDVVNAIADGLAQLWNLRDDQGNEINMGLTKVRVAAGPTMMPAVMKALSLPTLDSGESNLAVNGQNFMASATMFTRLSGRKIQLYLESPGFAPYIYQVFEDPTPVVFDENSEYCKQNDHLLFGTRGHYNIGCGRYQRALQINFNQA